ncbi:uncharacterized protein [Palaemon carinicauda]|uniref:uncharacterized protein n=1 Tax=Palaemon carinicauda TaxID=392227 RepID=UPI0035B667F8
MHRFLLSRVYCSSCQASEGGLRTARKLWEEVNIFCPSTCKYSQTVSPKTSLFISRQLHPSLDRVGIKTSVADIPDSSRCELVVMDPPAKSSGENKGKRVRKFSSPLRPCSSKRKAKGGGITSTEPPLICLDDIPLPSNPPTNAKDIPTIDFIPLPPSPPPLPPPLPTPPPPPEHTEMDEVLEEFYVLDTTASGTLFPIPLPPSYVSNKDENPKEARGIPENKPTHSLDNAAESDEISVVYNSDCVLPDQFKNINLVDISQDCPPSPERSADSSPVKIVFEGQWPWVVRSSDDLLGRKRPQVLHQQVRNCHRNANHDLRSLEKSPEPEIDTPGNTSQPDIIPLDPGTSSLFDSISPKVVRFGTRDNVDLDNEEEIIALESPSKKEKKSKKHKKKGKKEMSSEAESKLKDEIADKLKILRQQASSSNVQNVNAIDPDVVDIDDDSFSSSRGAMDMDVEVVELEDSDRESVNAPPAVSPERARVIDENDVDGEPGTSNSNHVGPEVDISTNEFIALGKARLQPLENTEIDIDDEVLQQRQYLEELRKWHTTRCGEEVFIRRKLRKKDTVFTLMSYNVLAQKLLTDNKFLYSECDPNHLEWGYRWALLQYEVQDLNPDVILFQEVQASHYYSHFLPWLTFKGYEGLYKKRTGEKCDGCAIFFKTDKFSLVESCSVEYLQPRAMKVLDRDNIGLIAKLASVASPESQVCVATTHFLYNPRRHDVKLAQAVLLLTELDRISYRGEKNGLTEYCPIILSGDFNSEPHTSLIDLFKEGRLRYEGLSSRTLTQHGNYPILEAEFIPRSLGITDRCQHAVLAQSRFLEQRVGQLFSLSDKRKIEESTISLANSSRVLPKSVGGGGSGHGPTPTGWYSHNFFFNSVYRHYSKNAVEATTFHNKWTSVDYIFYSRVIAPKLGRPVEGNLKLLARYGLLTGKEAARFAPLPSAVCPSDHFPLAAQFLLHGK